MPPPLPFPTVDQISEALERVRARALAVGTAVDPITEMEIQWHSISGVKYQLRYTDDLGATWTTLPAVYDGDGTLKSVVVPVNEATQRTYKLLENVPRGLNVVTAWDGTYVLLERSPLEPGDKHHLYRNGQHIGDILVDALSFMDTTVSPRSFYNYTAEAYGS